ncbi:excinuclease ABC subunit A, partial [Enterococcus faecalis]
CGELGIILFAILGGFYVSFFGKKPPHKAEKSFGNSQIFPRDYARRDQIELVLKELTELVAARLRKAHCQTECITVYV